MKEDFDETITRLDPELLSSLSQNSSRSPDNFTIVYFDLETSGFHKTVHILQIAAKCEEHKFDVYVTPTQPIGYKESEVTVPFKGPPRYNPKRRSVAFGGLTTSCSSSNLGTLTRIPSTQQHVSSFLTSSSGSSSLTRTISVNQYPTATLSRIPSTEQEYPLGLVSSVPSAEQYHSGTQSRVPSIEHYTGTLKSESYHNSLSRVPSMEQNKMECGTLRGIPSEQHVTSGALTRVQHQEQSQSDLSKIEHPNNTLNRLPSDYQIPNSLKDHNARLPNTEYYQNLRIEGLTRLQEHRLELQHRLDIHRMMDTPPSPSPSSRSLAPVSSASSSLSEGSIQPSGEDSASIITDKSLGDTASDVISDSSGVGTSQSDTTNSLTIPGTTVVCVEGYNSGIRGHLNINEGDILEVTGATDCGLLEGVLRGQGTGLFPAHCVQEVRLRHTSIPLGPQSARDGRIRVLGRRESQHTYFATAPRLKKPVTTEPRTVVLHRSKKGFGFVLRGAKSHALVGFKPTAEFPASQYLEDVDPGGVSDLAGLRKGDFLTQACPSRSAPSQMMMGDGRLSLAVSIGRDGETSVLGWPAPTWTGLAYMV